MWLVMRLQKLILKEYLLDFDEAERLKIEICDENIKTHKYTDIYWLVHRFKV